MALTEAVQSLTDFADAVANVKSRLAVLGAQIGDLEQEERRITDAPPHADEIVEVFQRGLGRACAGFERQLAERLSSVYVTGPRAATAVNADRAALVVTTDTRIPGAGINPVNPNLSVAEPGLDIGAVAYLLRDRIEAEIPMLVARLCPAAQEGMRRADRRAALASITQQLGDLRGERDRLQADLTGAQAAFRAPAVRDAAASAS